MAVEFVQTFTWGPIVNASDLQTHYFRIPFPGLPHIVASAYLAEVSIGQKDGRVGTAVATFKRFEFLDGNGFMQETELEAVSSFLEVDRCVSVTIALDLDVATGMGGWSFYFLS
ncbi:hypothetical protein NOV72_01997 [Caballeronia novacaledonica]|uniref:Uncharacterized protein n=1 Tax=Caballeronia novacaledonica TaxID=1544861 RepID=A0A2U3I3P5_9BURK|nr:hypothetical protein [Caballeronia novacaledonica]SPB14765.1 hypothetical protein NOV72_01997 [Caballeronia novacaledonica]